MNRIILAMISLAVMSTPAFAAMDIHTIYDMNGGNVTTDVDVSENSHSTFTAIGTVNGDLWADDQSYGMLETDVLANSLNGGSLQLDAWQDLPNGGGAFGSIFAGGTSTAYLNARMQSSPYVFEIERHDSSTNTLASASGASGSYELYHVLQTGTADALNAESVIDIWGSGSASFDMNQWHASGVSSYGWGEPNSAEVPNEPGYYTPTFTVSATGSGNYQQSGYGANSLNYNGFDMPGGGSATTTASFNDGFNGTPNTWAK